MKKFWKNANGRLKTGIIMTAFFFFVGFVIYYIPHINPFTFNTYDKNLPPSWEHWLGTTAVGQDVLWLLIEAIHNSLSIGLIVAFLGTVVGVFVGLVSGFSGGAVDRALMVVTDTFVVIPSLPILILMTALMKGSSTVILMALVLAMFAWAWPSRQIRSMALTLKERDFIHTARFSGVRERTKAVSSAASSRASTSCSTFPGAGSAPCSSQSAHSNWPLRFFAKTSRRRLRARLRATLATYAPKGLGRAGGMARHTPQ